MNCKIRFEDENGALWLSGDLDAVYAVAKGLEAINVSYTIYHGSKILHQWLRP